MLERFGAANGLNRHRCASAIDTRSNLIATMPTANKPLLRWLPFIAVAVISIAFAAWAPMGRKPFQLEWDLSTPALLFSVQKVPHIAACAMLALLAMLAAGRSRLFLAFALAVLVGGTWELAQTTVVGHTARLADLAPDTVGAILGCGWGLILATIIGSNISKHKLQRESPRPGSAS